MNNTCICCGEIIPEGKQVCPICEQEKPIAEIKDHIDKLYGCDSFYFGVDGWAIAHELYNARYRKIPENVGDFSDGYHTFNELYHHRAVLFSVICNMFPEKAWKSKLHDTGDMFDGMFIVGIETEQGQATYHYDIEPYWDMFKVKELEKAPKWDGHTPTDAIQRIGNMATALLNLKNHSVKGAKTKTIGKFVATNVIQLTIDDMENNQ